MANEKRKGVDKAALVKAFDDAAIAIKGIGEEVADLQHKYGVSSKLTIKKQEQYLALKSFYTTVHTYVEYMRELNYKMAVNMQGLEMMVMHHETGLPYEKIARVMQMNIDEQGKFKKLDDAEPLFRKIMDEILEIENIKFVRDNEGS